MVLAKKKPVAKKAVKSTTKTKKALSAKVKAQTTPKKKTPVKAKSAVKPSSTKKTKTVQVKVAPKKASAKKTVKKVVPAKKKTVKTVKSVKPAPKKQSLTTAPKKKAPVKTPATKTPVKKVLVSVKAKPQAEPRMMVAPIIQAMPKAAPKKKVVYNPGEFVVYPTHGVGRISEISTKKVAGQDLELVVVHFDKSRMTLRVPLEKAQDSLRKISDRSILQTALGVLQQKPKVKKAMWSRRQQEYETKINSGDPKLLAEVIRDLHRRHQMADQSYTERQIYETAFDRLAHELAAADKTDPFNAGEKIKRMLSQPAF